MNMFGIPNGGVAAGLIGPTSLPGTAQIGPAPMGPVPIGDPALSGTAPQPVAQPQGAFMWGAGGRRMTPAEIDAQRRTASQQMQADYSPVGHWTQGLARVANNITGAISMREADKAARANADTSTQIARALANPSVPAALPAPDLTTAPKGRGGLVGLFGRIF